MGVTTADSYVATNLETYRPSQINDINFQPVLGTAAITLPVPLHEERTGEVAQTTVYIKGKSYCVSSLMFPSMGKWLN